MKNIHITNQRKATTEQAITGSSDDVWMTPLKTYQAIIEVGLSGSNVNSTVESVNDQTGSVILNSDDISEGATNLYLNSSERTKLQGIESGAQVNTVVPNDLPTNLSELTNDSGYITDYTVTQQDVTQHSASIQITESQIMDLSAYLTTVPVSYVQENDNVSRLNNDAGFITGYTVTQGDVTQYEAVLQIDASQVSNLPSGSSDGGAVDSVNGQTGVVSLNTDDVSEGMNNKYFSAASSSKLDSIESGAEVNSVQPSDIPTATSQLSNDSGFITGYTVTQQDVVQYSGSLTITESQISDHGNYLTTIPATYIEDNDNISRLNNDAGYITSADVTGGTDLGISGTGDLISITSSTGDNVVIPTATDTVAGLLSISDKSKLDGIESGAQVNSSATEVKSLYESNTDTNVFTDSEKTKLTGIESNAEVNVQADWNAISGGALILNKPVIPTAVSDLTNDSGFITDYTVTQSDVTQYSGSLVITESQISDLGNYLTSIPASYIEDLDNISRLTNDSGFITDYTVTQLDVTQHESAITITESQISDLGNYLTSLPITVIEDGDNISRLTNDSGFITGYNVTQGDVTQYETFLTIDASQVTNLPSGSSGAVDSVNGQTGVVVLDADDLNEGTTNLFLSSAERSKLSGIASGAEVNVKSDWNAVSGDAQILNKPTIPSNSTDLLDSGQLIRINDNISSLTNDSGFITGYTVTQLDVTQHQAAITITESQISDLGNYLTSVSYLNLTGSPSDVISAGSNLSWDGNTLNVAASTAPVDSVNTQTGAVVLDTDDITEGVTNKYMSGDTYDQSTAMGTVVHGATAATARPSGYNVVTWVGSVEPTNAINNDIWFDTTA